MISVLFIRVWGRVSVAGRYFGEGVMGGRFGRSGVVFRDKKGY